MLVLVLASLSLVPAATAGPSERPCRSGRVALTFDDGPSPTMTPRLVRVLVRAKVPATFFMVGAKVRRTPGTARLVRDAGFTIGNHTWSHRELTRLRGPQIRRQVLKAGAELRRAGIDAGALMRPPYGAINARVSREIRRTGSVPVLWTADSMDWSGGSAKTIARRILAQLRPHRKNIVLQHDGVGNSAASVAAVPIVIRAARARGYCFADLGPRGGVALAGSTPASKARSGVGGAAPKVKARPVAPPTPLLDRIAAFGPVRPWMSLPVWAAAARDPFLQP